ncbi:MAG: FIG00684568: hypothetical protein [uncultured Sphingomonadaceae bacterium]|uniref:Peptidase S9 prolyl oligopeptidase catalytic domain-containing protein n=1 Tax=uncultured Sphingomonadaceae bacterium TaxID=169976 RepID=A0A6J4TGD7_9SPHN|nr:MAG: FIG00684568: hypothetical protein [uncultured Sphingomonadaceae bacterium]
MKLVKISALLGAALTTSPLGAQADPASPAAVPAPEAIVADGIPAVPAALARATKPYMESRSAGFLGWNPRTRGMLVATRFANTAQVHEVSMPGGARSQLTFEDEPVTQASYAEGRGDVLLVGKDVGGNEFFQVYALQGGRLNLLTDGKSRNTGGAWSADGRLFGYSSTRRNGQDTDLYVMDPRASGSDRMVAQVSGGGWAIADFSPDNRRALVFNYLSVNESELHELDLQTRQLRLLTPKGAEKVAYGGAQYGPDGTIYVTTDRGGEYRRLAVLDPRNGTTRAINPEARWDVESFDVADDGSFIAYAVNEEGVSRLRLLNPRTGRAMGEAKLPAGTIGGVDAAPWGQVGFTLTSAKSPADAHVLDPKTMRVTRWTFSETGGLDPSANVEPELVRVKSFDGEEVSGFLYRPDARRFPGRRPLIVNIHGGPEGQSRPGFLGRTNYLINELGVAVFYPNVRGSTGFGKRFVALDNGAFKREDSVQDIGAFLDRLGADRGVDAGRIAVTGGSYGGYMCYASAIRYGERLKGANCIVAISDFNTFLENTQGYRRDLRRVEYGDERVPEQRAKLAEISPLRRAKEIRIPLMVVTGGNDPRVPASEADQMVQAVRGNGRPAWHLLAKNEGHGFAKKENADYQFWTSLMFWQQNLLGQGGAGAATATGSR